MRVAIYARVSTEDQDCEIQLTNLRAYVQRADWGAAVEYVEKLSGKEGMERPRLKQLLEDARMRRLDLVLVWKMDRFGRSALDTLQNVRELDHAGVRFLCPTMNIDTDNKSPMGRFTLTMFAAIAELERDFILERTGLGQQAYRKAYDRGEVGKSRHSKSGRDLPVGRPRAIFDREKARLLRASGATVRQVAAQFHVGVATILRELKPRP